MDNDVIQVANNLVDAVVKNTEGFSKAENEENAEERIENIKEETNFSLDLKSNKHVECKLNESGDFMNEQRPNSVLITPESLPDLNSPQRDLFSYELNELTQTNFLHESFEEPYPKNIQSLNFSSPERVEGIDTFIESLHCLEMVNETPFFDPQINDLSQEIT